MMARGRKPNPTKLRLLTEPGARIIGSDGAPPPPPDFLEGEGLAEWDRIVPELSKRYLISPVDAVLLAGYCQTFADYKVAVLAVRESGLMLDGKLNPAARYAAQSLAELRKMAAEFGLSPSARSRFDVPAPVNEEEDEFAAFVGEE
jgi:P27 family predicted phage terminase small subunit